MRILFNWVIYGGDYSGDEHMAEIKDLTDEEFNKYCLDYCWRAKFDFKILDSVNKPSETTNEQPKFINEEYHTICKALEQCIAPIFCVGIYAKLNKMVEN